MKTRSRSDVKYQTGKYSSRSNYRPNMLDLASTVVEKDLNVIDCHKIDKVTHP